MEKYQFDPTKAKSFAYQQIAISYNNWVNHLIRMALFGFLGYVALSQLLTAKIPVPILSFLFVMLTFELYMQTHVHKQGATKKLSEDKNLNLAETCSHETVALLIKAPQADFLMTELLKRPEIRFVVTKLSLKIDPAAYKTLNAEAVLQQAASIALSLNHNALYPTHFFASILVLTEDDQKTLFNAEIKKEDLYNCIEWAHRRISGSWSLNNNMGHLGIGIGHLFVDSWGIELAKYTDDLTLEVASEPQILVGREKEVNLIEETLSNRVSSNVLLLGQPGIGKESVVRSLALRMFTGQSRPNLNYKRVIKISLGQVIAGTNGEGDISERLNTLMEEVTADRNIILYIPNIHDLFDKNKENDITKIFLPYLNNPKVKIIGTSTAENYRTTMDKEPILRDQFMQISLQEPDKNNGIKILQQASDELERRSKVKSSYQALREIMELGNKYSLEKVQPGKAIELLNSAFTRCETTKKPLIETTDIRSLVTELTNIPAGLPSEEEKGQLLNLEEILHRRVVGQDEAITAIAKAIRTSRAQLGNGQKPIGVFLFLGPTGVGKTETAKTLAEVYYKDEKNMVRIDMSEFQTLESNERLIGTETLGGLLTEPVRKNPYSLILLDEFEKANPKILEIFLQVFDDGRLTDGEGRVINYTNTIIICTSNANSELIRNRILEGKTSTEFREELIDSLQRESLFKPELINRFDSIVVYKPLVQEEIEKIAKLMIKQLISTLDQQDVTLVVTDEALRLVAAQGFDLVYGARPLRRYLNDHVQTEISRMLISGELKRGQTIKVDVSNEKLRFSVN